MFLPSSSAVPRESAPMATFRVPVVTDTAALYPTATLLESNVLVPLFWAANAPNPIATVRSPDTLAPNAP